MRIKQRANQILHDNDEAKLSDEAILQEHPQMGKPKETKQRQSRKSPLDRDVKRLIVRIRNYLCRDARLADRVALKQLQDRTRSMTENGSVTDKAKRFAPEFNPLADGGWHIRVSILEIL